MGNLTGAAGGGSFLEQVKIAGASTVAGTEPAAGTPVLSPTSESGSFNTGGIDRQGANVILANFQVGAVTASGLFSVLVQHSNDDGVTDSYTSLASTTQNITSAAVSIAALGGANANVDTSLFTDLRGAKKWIRYAFTLTSGTSAYLGITAFLSAYDTLPTTDY